MMLCYGAVLSKYSTAWTPASCISRSSCIGTSLQLSDGFWYIPSTADRAVDCDHPSAPKRLAVPDSRTSGVPTWSRSPLQYAACAPTHVLSRRLRLLLAQCGASWHLSRAAVASCPLRQSPIPGGTPWSACDATADATPQAWAQPVPQCLEMLRHRLTCTIHPSSCCDVQAITIKLPVQTLMTSLAPVGLVRNRGICLSLVACAVNHCNSRSTGGRLPFTSQ